MKSRRSEDNRQGDWTREEIADLIASPYWDILPAEIRQNWLEQLAQAEQQAAGGFPASPGVPCIDK